MKRAYDVPTFAAHVNAAADHSKRLRDAHEALRNANLSDPSSESLRVALALVRADLRLATKHLEGLLISTGKLAP